MLSVELGWERENEDNLLRNPRTPSEGVDTGMGKQLVDQRYDRSVVGPLQTIHNGERWLCHSGSSCERIQFGLLIYPLQSPTVRVFPTNQMRTIRRVCRICQDRMKRRPQSIWPSTLMNRDSSWFGSRWQSLLEGLVTVCDGH